MSEEADVANDVPSKIDLSRLRKKRSANRNVVRGLLTKVKTLISKGHDEEIRKQVEATLQVILAKEKGIRETDENIQDAIDEDILSQDIEEAVKFEIDVGIGKIEVEEYLNRSKGNRDSKKKSEATGVKLPKLVVKTFTGEPTEWQQFEEIFKPAVDSNNSISKIEKFSYLKSYLAGEAEKCVEGIPLSEENYLKAFNLLEERYGNKQLVIMAHVKKLLGLEKISMSRSIRDLRNLYDEVEIHVRSLCTLNVKSEHYGPMLIPIILDRLPDDIKLQISRKLGKESWSIEEFMETLKVEISARESCNLMKKNPVEREEKTSCSNRITTEALMTGAKVLVCAFCSKDHYHDKCTVVTDPAERKEIARRNRLCYKCLFKGHSIRNCKSKKSCFHCKSGSHQSAICKKMVKKDDRNEKKERSGGDSEIEKHHTTLVGSRTSVILQTASGIVSDNYEKRSASVKIVLDSGSERTYITEKLVKRLQLQSNSSQNVELNTFGSISSKSAVLKFYSFCVKNPERGCILYLTGFAVPTICVPLATYERDVVETAFPGLEQLNISDVQTDKCEIDLLIGSDYYWSVVEDENRRCRTEGLVAVKSKLGWLLSGPLKQEKRLDSSSVKLATHSMIVALHENHVDAENLDAQVEKFWDLDTLGIKVNELSVYDKCIEEIKIVGDRYEIRNPFKEDHPIIEDNYTLALARLMKLKKNLDKNPKVLEQYDGIIRNYINLDILEKARNQPIVGQVTYLPHRCLIREVKETTKMRLVFDASAKNKGPSLNECLYKGKNLNPLLFEIFLRFRVHNIALSADAEAAYLQISIAPDERDYGRLLWFDDVHKSDPEIIKLRFTRVFFGSGPSQFLLNGVFRVHINKYSDEDPDFEKFMLRHLYVDDLNGSVPTVKEAMDIYEKVKSRFSEVNFNFRKWRTNDVDLMKYFSTQENVEETKEKESKVLGILWNYEDDVFSINTATYVSGADKLKPTKRTVLKLLAGIYDVTGFIHPLTVKFKLLFQGVWALGVGWDQYISDELAKKWRKIIEEFENTGTIIIPRCYCRNDLSNPIIRTELHAFSDASLSSYAACLFFRFIKRDGEVCLSFVTAKSRLVPMRKTKKQSEETNCTVPRLELMGNFLLSKLVVSCVDALSDEMKIDEIVCWSDSMVSIAWIKARNKEFRTFVQNRVIGIRKNIKDECWRHCRSEDNAADILTKDKAVDIKSWLRGPSFLQNPDFELKNVDNLNQALGPEGFADEVKERKIILHTKEIVNRSIGNLVDIKRYNDLIKLLRVTAFVLRFINNLKSKVKNETLILNKNIITSEMKEAKILWVKDNQNTLTKEESYDNLKINLNLQVDEYGIVRSYSRLKHAKVPMDVKAPIFLNKSHKFAELVVYHSHLRCLHRGVRQTLTELRSTYWISKARSFVKKLLRPCIVCKRLNVRAYEYPRVADLPEFRFDFKYAFSSTGIDYFGPLYCSPVYGNDENMVYKAWVVLFTCAYTRAISLEVVNDSSATTFINCFTRFVARRGCPNKIITDKGSVFTADETQKFLASRFVESQFTLDSAPWQGGLWERMVACVKRCMKKMVGVKTLSYVELQTVVTEVEQILNNRPIGADFENGHEDVITPNHLMTGRRLETFSESTSDENNVEVKFSDMKVVKRKRHLDSMLDHFWTRWRKEYLDILRESQRNESGRRSAVPKVSDVVIVYDEKVPRQLWRLGKIMKLLTSDDGKIRGAEVKMGKTNALIRRPVNKLYPLISNDDELINPTPYTIETNIDDPINTTSNTVEKISLGGDTKIQSNDMTENLSAEARKRPRRNAAIFGDLRRKYES